MRCHHCHGKFGLTRHRLLTWTGYLCFCREKCLVAYRTRIQEDINRIKFLESLKVVK
jgi:hypothetical protein